MSSMDMALVVARKEMRNIIRNRGLLFGGLWFGGMFGVFNMFSGYVTSLNNEVYSVALLVGVFVGYSFSSFVFLREKRESHRKSALHPAKFKVYMVWKGLRGDPTSLFVFTSKCCIYNISFKCWHAYHLVPVCRHPHPHSMRSAGLHSLCH